MNIALIVLSIEIIVVFIGIFGFWFFIRWKKNKAKLSEIEILLDTINSQESQRSSFLLELLEKNYSLDHQQAQKISVTLIETEKQFLKQFIKQQIEQTDLTGYYQNLCIFLDQYIALIPSIHPETGVALDESADTMDDVTNASYNAELNKQDNSTDKNQVIDNEADSSETNSESEAEPDWGHAFSESGDTMDDETNASYNAELKKE